MTKYLVSGYIGFDNFGDEAIASVLVSNLKKQNAELKKQINWRQDDLDRLQKQLEQLQQKYDRLLMAHQLISEDKEEREVARKKIDKMVREIDKCLNLLLE